MASTKCVWVQPIQKVSGDNHDARALLDGAAKGRRPPVGGVGKLNGSDGTDYQSLRVPGYRVPGYLLTSAHQTTTSVRSHLHPPFPPPFTHEAGRRRIHAAQLRALQQQQTTNRTTNKQHPHHHHNNCTCDSSFPFPTVQTESIPACTVPYGSTTASTSCWHRNYLKTHTQTAATAALPPQHTPAGEARSHGARGEARLRCHHVITQTYTQHT